MRVFLSSPSPFPARNGGLSSSRVQDCLAKGLAELGHTVYYSFKGGSSTCLPDGVVATNGPEVDADIYHMSTYPCSGTPPPPGKPWLRTVHCPYRSEFAAVVCEQLIFVSRAQARTYGVSRYVWNGIDPQEFIYSACKQDYFLFVVSHLSRAQDKGLAMAIRVAEHVGVRLLVVGQIDVDPSPEPNVTYLGEVYGERKANLLAGAKALLFPGHVAETFGLVVAEALMSGTPVITGTGGGLPELVTPEVGFTCDTFEDYLDAVERVGVIQPAACRQRADTVFHYRAMTRRYLAEYERELGA